MSKIPLNFENFDRVSDYLHLNEKPQEKTDGRFTTYLSAKVSQLSKKVQGEIRSFFSYGCSRNAVSKIILKELGNKVDLKNNPDKLSEKAVNLINDKINNKEKQINEDEKQDTIEASSAPCETQKLSPVDSEIKEKFQKAIKENRLTEEMVHPSLVNAPLKNGQLPLHYAIHHCSAQTIELLLPHADLHAVDKEGFNAFDHAVQMSKTPLAERIMKKLMEEDWESLQKSCEKVKKTQGNILGELQEQYGNQVARIPIAEKLKLFYGNMTKGNIEGVIELVMGEPALLLAQKAESKQTLLHLAVEQKNEVLLLFFLSQLAKLSHFENFLEVKDTNGNTAEKLAERNEDLSRLFKEFKNNTLTEKTKQLYVKELLPSLMKHGEKIEAYNHISEVVKRGYNGHNSLQVQAIKYSDFRAFIRNVLDGADISTRDSKTGETLLHLAVKNNQPEILYFLAMAGMNLQVKALFPEIAESGENGLTPLELAKKYQKQDLIDLLSILEEIQKSEKELPAYLNEHQDIPLPLKNRLVDLDKDVVGYIEAYKKKQAEYTEEEAKERFNLAKHGLLPYREVCQGHNQLAFTSIIQGDLDALVRCGELGANLHTTGIPLARALEDPMGYGAMFTKAKKELLAEVHSDEPEEEQSGVDYVLNKVIEKTWGIKRGDGKSLLDVAVLYAKEGEENLEIIAYLLSKGLDPLKLNDEGESPLSIALIKGNLKAASLMMNHARFAEGKNLELDGKSFNRALSLLSEGANLRDPLYVSSSKIMEGAFAGIYLLSSYFADSFNYVQFLPLVISRFISGPSFREALTRKQESPPPKIVQQIYPIISKAAVLEMSVLPKNPIGYLASSVMGLYLNTRSVFSSFKTSASNFTSRPGQVIYKTGLETLGVAQNIFRVKSLFSYMFFKPIPEKICKKVNPKDYEKLVNLKERLEKEELDPTCPEHAKIIMSSKWNQELLNGNTSYVDDKQKTNKLFRKYAVEFHPDKNPSKEQNPELFAKNNGLFEKLNTARNTLLGKENTFIPQIIVEEPKEDSRWDAFKKVVSSERAGVVWNTAAKASIIWGSTRQFMKKIPVLSALTSPLFWDMLSLDAMTFNLSSKVLRLGSTLYRSARG